jgi:peroxiredoxin
VEAKNADSQLPHLAYKCGCYRRYEMVKALRKYISPLIIIAVVALSVFSFMVVRPWKKANDKERELASQAASYKERSLPQAPLTELKSGDDYFEKVKHSDVLLIYLMVGCDACEKELQTIAGNASQINPGVQIYGVMFQDQETVSQYIQKYNVNFPILLDKDGKLRRALGVKYFPTNFKLNNGTIKEAWFGFPNERENFLQMVNLRQS